MKEKNYKHLLDLFIHEVKKLRNPSFINLENWTIADDLLNGVAKSEKGDVGSKTT